MESNYKHSGEMKIFVSVFAVIVFVAQSISFVLNALNQKLPANTMESLYHDFVLFAYSCSLLTIVIFEILYVFNFNSLKNKGLNILFLMIVAPGIYIHVGQFFVLNSFKLTSCALLFFDSYILCKILNNLFTRGHTP